MKNLDAVTLNSHEKTRAGPLWIVDSFTNSARMENQNFLSSYLID